MNEQIDLTQDERAYEAIKANLEKRATRGQKEFRIGTRMIERIPLPELQALAGQYYQRIKAGRAQNAGKSLFGTIRTE